VSFAVRVQARASRDESQVSGRKGFKIRLTAPPVDDRANEALRRFLATSLNVPLALLESRQETVADRSAWKFAA